MARPPLTIEQILAILRESPGRLATITGGLDESQLRAAPQPEEWSVTEVLAHLRACADVWGDAIDTILRSDRPTIRAVNPRTYVKSTGYPALEFGPSLRDFTAQRERLNVVLASLPEADWSRAATVLGGGNPLELTVHRYAHRLARHERTHWKQMEKTVRALRG
jgi:hypothetical protein